MLRRRKKKIMFVGHDASLSGAPVLLLNLLLLLKKETDLKISVIIRREGSFIKAYREHFPVIILKRSNYGKEESIFQRMINLARNRFQVFRVIIMAFSADVIFSNTIINGRLLKLLSPFKSKIITYVHELKNVVEYYRSSGDSFFSLKYSAIFAYPSLKVGEMLESYYRINKVRLRRLSYYFPIDSAVINDQKAKHDFVHEFRRKFNITCKFLVGSAGTLNNRKGADLFLRICQKVVMQNKNIQFCWIGQFEDLETERVIKNFIRDEGISDNIILTGSLPHHLYNFCAFDIFLLSSREDPYPLVVIESAFMKVPTLCFEKSGGITEFISGNAGWSIENFSIDDAAQKILQLVNNPWQINERGLTAYKKALNLHSNKDLVLGQFNRLINDV